MPIRGERRLSPLVALVTIAITSLAPSIFDARAGDDSGMGEDYYAGLDCNQLWYERNAIFASKGYCFKSQRAIATFGERCQPPYGELPDHLLRVVKEIKAWERRRGC